MIVTQFETSVAALAILAAFFAARRARTPSPAAIEAPEVTEKPQVTEGVTDPDPLLTSPPPPLPPAQPLTPPQAPQTAPSWGIVDYGDTDVTVPPQYPGYHAYQPQAGGTKRDEVAEWMGPRMDTRTTDLISLATTTFGVSEATAKRALQTAKTAQAQAAERGGQ